MPETVYIGLGSNLGVPEDNLRLALGHLGDLAGVENVTPSCFYKTPPFGITDQPEFVNAVARADTTLLPQQLLTALLLIEHEMGRVRTEKWGPRIIDLDILLFGNRVMDEPGLTIPHPGIPDREFVLAPMVDLAPDCLHPTRNATMRELLNQLGGATTARPIESER